MTVLDNQMERAEAAEKDAALMRVLARNLSNALLKVRPLGGSELFIKVGTEYYADPDYCGAVIDKMKSDLHEVNRALIMARKKFA